MKEIFSFLRNLDQILERAVAQARESFGPQAAADPFRGLYINSNEAAQLLRREPGAPLLRSAAEKDDACEQQPYVEGSEPAWLKDAFGLSNFDLDVILLALAPELDTRYERLYAYLQDHVARRRPSVELALNLLCASAEEKMERRVHFTPDAPLISNKLIHLIAEPQQQTALLSSAIRLDEQITNLLLSQEGLDSRLASFCELIHPTLGLNSVPLPAETRRVLFFYADQACRRRRPLHLYFHGPRGAGKKMTASALAWETGKALLVTDLSAVYRESEWKYLLPILLREAWFKNAVLCLADTDALFNDESLAPGRQMLKMLSENTRVIAILTGTKPWLRRGLELKGMFTVPFPVAGYAFQQNFWNESLAAAGIVLSDNDLNTLAGRFSLTRQEIISAVDLAKTQASWNSAAAALADDADVRHCGPTLKEIFRAARAQSGSELASLASKIEARYTWEDIILPSEALTQLQQICQRVIYRRRVLVEWGFDAKLALGKGVNALFTGPSGTGKTMAAEIIANELGLDLYKIDLAGVVSKYIGETEKNLDRIFSAAESANAILLFDEADALFGKRSEVRDAHDRYANIEISYLLQKMEQYEGITILTTNLRQNLDDAFVRRIAFILHFAFPDEESRLCIWKGIWPKAAPLAPDVQLEFLARQFKLSGGNIKNIALTASYLAAAASCRISMKHLLQATKDEYQKMGKTLSETELYGGRITPAK